MSHRASNGWGIKILILTDIVVNRWPNNNLKEDIEAILESLEVYLLSKDETYDSSLTRHLNAACLENHKENNLDLSLELKICLFKHVIYLAINSPAFQ